MSLQVRPHSNSDQPDSRLLSLPDELEVLILKQLLSRGALEAMPSSNYDLTAAILYTCRDLYHKGTEVLYKDNTPTMILQPGNWMGHRRWKNKAPGHLPYIDHDGAFVILGEVYIRPTWYSEHHNQVPAAIPRPRTWSTISRFRAIELLIAGPTDNFSPGTIWDFVLMARQTLPNTSIKIMFQCPNRWVDFNRTMELPVFEVCLKAFSQLRCQQIEFANIPSGEPQIEQLARSVERLVMSREPVVDYYSILLQYEDDLDAVFSPDSTSRACTYLRTMQDRLVNYEIGDFRQALRLGSLLVERYKRRQAGRVRARAVDANRIARRVKARREERRKRRRNALIS
ncbi:hypothetical protein LTS08_001345 [Lithohypha guttulata]|uniref:uncharacterized protein n=1 Tax=Lithohypha guttulata TaxID=1690604 RepID=UPI002DE0BFE4|nr:hypothetical protein LTS08_001345 [Lithohypha guttulata]